MSHHKRVPPLKTFFRTLIVSASLIAVSVGVRWVFFGPEENQPSADVVVFSFHPQVDTSIDLPVPLERLVQSELNKLEIATSELQKNQLQDVAVQEAPALVKTASLKSVLQVSNPSNCEYVVEEGDRLDKISMKFFGTHRRYKDILAANPGLDPRRMKPGQKLIIPDIRHGLPVQPVVFVQRSEPQTREYTVKPGDVLGKIAQEQLGSSRYSVKILEVNPGLDPLKLKPSQVIRLPVLGLSQNN
jgi:nucleoid-associated protein YgaU